MSNGSQNNSYGVIGGGITGLATAYYLLKVGHKATVFEAGSDFGGLVSSVKVHGVWIDKFYHCILPSDIALLSLIDDLGLGNRVYWQETEMGFLHQRTLYPFTTLTDLIRFSPLSITDRLRMGFLVVYSQYLKDWRRLERITAEEWLTRICGKACFDTIWKPLLSFKFGDQYGQIPATWIWGRFKRQSTTRKVHSQKEVVAYIDGGYRGVVERLVEDIQRLGGIVYPSTKVDSLMVQHDQVKGIQANGECYEFDRVVSTIPIPQFLKLIDWNILGSKDLNGQIRYQGVVCVLLVLKKRLSPYYWIPVVDGGAPFSGIVETTNLIRSEELGGVHLVYLLNYMSAEKTSFLVGESEICERCVLGLERMFPEFDTSYVLESKVFKTPFVEPVWKVNYSERMPRKVLFSNTLYLLTTAQLYPEINNVSNCVQQVLDSLDQITANY